MASKDGEFTESHSKKKTAGSIAEDRLVVAQRRLAVAVLSIILIYFAWGISSYFADVIRIFGISILISYLFINLVDWLEKVLLNRAVAILIVYLVLIIVLVLGVLLVVPAMVYQV